MHHTDEFTIPFIQAVIEEWRDQCIAAGFDFDELLVLYNPDMTKDLAREIFTRTN
jgi:hypothetical protein